jgi:hypothetical protein
MRNAALVYFGNINKDIELLKIYWDIGEHANIPISF